MEDQNSTTEQRFEAWKVKAKAIIDNATLDSHHHILVVHGKHGDVNVTGATCPGFILEVGHALIRRAVEVAIFS